MPVAAVLNDQQRQWLEQARRLLGRTLEALASWEAPAADLERLRQAVRQLDELFLLVVVGEFNSGKSALINALLGGPFLPEGPTPTTDRVYIVQHGEPAGPEPVQEDIRLLRFPAALLHEVSIVDTPGTNAVLRRHEAIARDFVPRADLVLFVTSADRPFTESERAFLESIRQWGKKVVVVINKSDLLDSPQAAREVESFVRGQVRRLLDFEPELFLLSARAGLRAPAGGDAGAQGFREFREHLRRSLTEAARVRLKLLSPLGVARKLAGEAHARAEERRQVLAADRRALQQVEQQLAAYETETQAEFGRHLARIENDLLQMSLRGEAFLDDHMRLLRLGDMLQGRRMRRAFEQEVVAETPERITAHVQEVIDWLVERELGLWRRTAADLNRHRQTGALHQAAHEPPGGFVENRRRLLEDLGAQAESVLRGYDRTAEAARLTSIVQESVAMVGLVQVGAIGLGLALKALLTTAAADATGILAAGVLGVLGLAVIPWRRGVAKREFRRKMLELRGTLEATLRESFGREHTRALGRLHEQLQPLRAFVGEEQGRLDRVSEALAEAVDQMRTLQARIEAGG